MKTYAESQDEEPFDWNEFLSRKKFTRSSLSDAVTKAGSWVTCACGNQCNKIPRGEEGAPEDPSLNYLGLKFSKDIESICSAFHESRSLDSYLKQARETLKEIEERSSYLLSLVEESEPK